MVKSDYLAAAVLNAWLRGVSPTLPSAWYLALYTVAPTSAGGGTEISGGGYLRTAVTFAAPSGGICANTGAVNFPTPTLPWGQVVAVGVFDAISSGHMLYFKTLPTAKAVDAGFPVFFPDGYLTIQEL